MESERTCATYLPHHYSDNRPENLEVMTRSAHTPPSEALPIREGQAWERRLTKNRVRIVIDRVEGGLVYYAIAGRPEEFSRLSSFPKMYRFIANPPAAAALAVLREAMT